MKQIPDFPNYVIDVYGQVYSYYKFKTNIVTDTLRPVKAILDNGYYIVTLCHQNIKENRYIHRLLAELYIPNPLNKEHVNHIDANKQNNTLSNLEWTTPQENARHAAQLGLYQPCIDATSVSVAQICLETNTTIACFSSIHEAARQTKVAYQNIWKVCNNKRKSAGGFKWEYT